MDEMTTKLVVVIVIAVVLAIVCAYVYRLYWRVSSEVVTIINRIIAEARLGEVSTKGFNTILSGVLPSDGKRYKVCKCCGKIKPEEDFPKEHSVCKECKSKLRKWDKLVGPDQDN